MRCLRHPLQEVLGYCCECGEFGCTKCIVEHEGKFYCRKHYQPIADAIARQQRHEELKHRADRQRLLVEARDGKQLLGFCLALNPQGEDFYLEVVDRKGETQGRTVHCRFANLKAVHYIKSFDGQFDPEQQHPEWQPQGGAVVVEFADGEVLEGHAYTSYRRDIPRFHVVPDDPRSNDISVLVERAATVGIYDRDAYQRKLHEERDAYVAEHDDKRHPREELVGDFYASKKQYQRAHKYYRAALKDNPPQERVGILRKKMASARYNIAIHYLRRHEYAEALQHLRAALEGDPENEQTRKKIAQVQEHLRHHDAA